MLTIIKQKFFTLSLPLKFATMFASGALFLIILAIVEAQEWFYPLGDMGGPIIWVLVVISLPYVIFITLLSSLLPPARLITATLTIFFLLFYHFFCGFFFGKLIEFIKRHRKF